MGHGRSERRLEQPLLCHLRSPHRHAGPVLGLRVLYRQGPRQSGWPEQKALRHGAMDRTFPFQPLLRHDVCPGSGGEIFRHQSDACGHGPAVPGHRQLHAQVPDEFHHRHQGVLGLHQRRKLECHPPVRRPGLGDLRRTDDALCPAARELGCHDYALHFHPYGRCPRSLLLAVLQNAA